MKILFIAPYCFGLEHSMADAFIHHGHDVRRIIYGEHNREKNLLMKMIYNHYGWVRKIKKSLDMTGALNSYMNRGLNNLNRHILFVHETFHPDLVFIVKGEPVFPDTLRAMKDSLLVSYHWDDPFLSYQREEDGTGDTRYQNIVQSCPLYDLTFVYDEYYLELLKERGAKRPHYLLDWYEPEIFAPKHLNEKERQQWGADVAFVGSPYKNRLDLFQALTSFDLGVWGPEFRWREIFGQYPSLRKHYRGEASAREAVLIYNASKICFNQHDTFQCKSSVVNRTFQILAAGGFEMVDDRPKLYELFDVGKDLVSFASIDDAVSKIHYYLEHEAERDAIRGRGLKKALGHSARDRVHDILDHVQSLTHEAAAV